MFEIISMFWFLFQWLQGLFSTPLHPLKEISSYEKLFWSEKHSGKKILTPIS